MLYTHTSLGTYTMICAFIHIIGFENPVEMNDDDETPNASIQIVEIADDDENGASADAVSYIVTEP